MLRVGCAQKEINVESFKIKSLPKMLNKEPLRLQLPVDAFRSLPIPGVANARLGTCFVRVVDLPSTLDRFMEINPRVPSRSKAGVLSGPVAKGILETLREQPEEMVLKNQGIYLLVQSFEFAVLTADDREPKAVILHLTNIGKHGIINGGHTYAAIREAVETASPEELEELKRAYVRLNIFQGVDEDWVPEIAEGLNRSKQVDDPSLVNLQGDFDAIRKVMKGKPGESAISYHQGDAGDVYISEVLVYLEMFNRLRFNDKKHPNSLYNRQGLGLRYFSEDMQENPKHVQMLIHRLPEIVKLADQIRLLVPTAATRNHLQFGRIKVGSERAGSARPSNIPLPFIDKTTAYRVPNGWVYPMLAAFRANMYDDGNWRMPIDDILPAVIDDLARVCVVEHRDNNMRPELIGKRESAYSACYLRVQLFLAKMGKL